MSGRRRMISGGLALAVAALVAAGVLRSRAVEAVPAPEALGPLGACCHGSGGCGDNTTEEQCTAVGSVWHEGATCATVTCIVGACCTPEGGCGESARAWCEEVVGGIYRGDGSRCGDFNGNGQDDVCEALGPAVPVSISALQLDTGYTRLVRLLSDGTTETRLVAFDTGDPCVIVPGLGCGWAPIDGCVGDLDNSGDVGFSDVLELINRWGPCPRAADGER